MAQSVLIVGDPLTQLKPASDTSLALAEAAIAKGFEVYWCEPADVGVLGADVVITASHRVLDASKSGFRWDAETSERLRSLTYFDTVWVRKDPPFDEAYKTLCWILASQVAVSIANPAELLLAHHEKALQLRARAEGAIKDWELIPTCVTSNLALAEAFLTQSREEAELFVSNLRTVMPEWAQSAQTENALRWVVKPWLGHGGGGVEAFADADAALAHLRERVGRAPEPTWMLQPFLPQIRTVGDRRVFIVKGEIVCDFVRIPKEGRIAANLAQGGRATLVPLSPAQRDVCERLAAWLKAKGIAIAGVDLIDTFVGEINITSPTGLRTYEDLTGHSVAARAVDLLLGPS